MFFRAENQENSKISELIMNESLSEDEEDGTGLESLGISSQIKPRIQPKFLSKNANSLGPWESGEQNHNIFSENLLRSQSYALPIFFNKEQPTRTQVHVINSSSKKNQSKDYSISSSPHPLSIKELMKTQNFKTDQQCYDNTSQRMNSYSSSISSSLFQERQKKLISLHNDHLQNSLCNKQLKSSLAELLLSRQNQNPLLKMKTLPSSYSFQSPNMKLLNQKSMKSQETEIEDDLYFDSLSFDEQHRNLRIEENRKDIHTAPAPIKYSSNMFAHLFSNNQTNEYSLKESVLNNDDTYHESQSPRACGTIQSIQLGTRKLNPSRITIRKHLEINSNTSRPSKNNSSVRDSLASQAIHPLVDLTSKNSHELNDRIINKTNHFNQKSTQNYEQQAAYQHSSIYFTLKKPIVGSINLQRHGRQIKKKLLEKQQQQQHQANQQQQQNNLHSEKQFVIPQRETLNKSCNSRELSEFRPCSPLRFDTSRKKQRKLQEYPQFFSRQLTQSKQSQKQNCNNNNKQYPFDTALRCFLTPDKLRNPNGLPCQSQLKRMKQFLTENDEKKNNKQPKTTFFIDYVCLK